jgi:RNA polymerase sigma factor (sigma-70 family)
MMNRLQWDKFRRVHVKDLMVTRRSLISRLRRFDDGAWSSFFETYWRLIYSAAVELGLTESEAEEVVQETMICVWKSIPKFKYDPEQGSFRNWLLHLTFWRIKDQWRKRKQTAEATQREIEMGPELECSDLNRLWDREWENNLLNAALERVKAKADGKNYQLFELYVLQEWPIAKIRSVLNVSAARIYLAKHRITALVAKELKYLKAEFF